MYYIAWLILVVVVALWKRELKETKAAYLTILGELKSERMEFDKLKERYLILLNGQGDAPVARRAKTPSRKGKA
ncbi:hypothetical protein [Candidatus Magnetominusculus dajiuhuensis]|uniref:hypothetical protein n=1 Tax=Candidatus Magnetominusculus dajiuhuensis TaxID=3137712 RepID=UPI003B430ED1